MSVSDADIAFARDLFAPLGTITHRKMMGGATYYCDGNIFAITSADGTIYLKADGAFADKLAAEGSEIFSFTRKKDGAVGTMGYWTLPDAALDDADAACDWARQALEHQQ